MQLQLIYNTGSVVTHNCQTIEHAHKIKYFCRRSGSRKRYITSYKIIKDGKLIEVGRND